MLYLAWAISMYYILTSVFNMFRWVVDQFPQGSASSARMGLPKLAEENDEGAAGAVGAGVSSLDGGRTGVIAGGEGEEGGAGAMAVAATADGPASAPADAVEATGMSEEQRAYLAMLKQHKEKKSQQEAEGRDDFAMHATAAYAMIMSCMAFFFFMS